MTGDDVAQRWTSRAVADAYDAERFSGPVGRWFNRASRKALGRCLRRLGPGLAVADVPCGTGRMLPVLAATSASCVAADVSAAMMAKARERPYGGTPVHFVGADARSLPLRDGAVDAVVSVRFAMHLTGEQRVPILREFGRVCRQWVVVEYGYDSPWHRVRGAVRSVLLRLIGQRRTYPAATPPAQIRQEARQAGLVVRRWFWTLPVLSQSVFVLMEKSAGPPDGATESYANR